MEKISAGMGFWEDFFAWGEDTCRSLGFSSVINKATLK